VSITYELILFAAFGFAIGGIDDLLVDIIWISRHLWRRVAIYSRHSRATVASLSPTASDGPLAIFIPAWDEALVINAMVKNCLRAWQGDNYRIFVGCYWNDVPSQAAVAQIRDPRVTIALVPHAGPTTKADCLNHIWQRMLRAEADEGIRYNCIVFHDAEDVVHRDELALFRGLSSRFQVIQIPVVPLVDRSSRWISGHYLDEFAEAHGKAMVVREAIGAALPLAGVGCAIRRDAVQWLADIHAGKPFVDDSLTEDYEMGLRLGTGPFKAAFVRLLDRDGRDIIAVRALFPGKIDASVKQKTRWIIGIALVGWERLGWQGGLFETWMRFRDRRGIYGAIVIVAGYLAVIVTTSHYILGIALPAIGPGLASLLALNAFLMIWRLCVRAAFVAANHGWVEGLMSVPRTMISNMIGVIAARRAVAQYARLYARGELKWAKTDHKFPDLDP
jgi:bacteriophage N4 adsorption protein B